MYGILLKKLKESLVSVLPVVGIVILIYLTPFVSLTPLELGVFLISAVALVIGIGLFNLGADLAMTPMGELVGAGLTRSGNIKLLLSVSALMGVLITVAEPDLSVLAEQVGAVINGTLLIVTVGVGVGFFLLLSILKMLFKVHLSSMLMFFYFVLFAFVALLLVSGNGDFFCFKFHVVKKLGFNILYILIFCLHLQRENDFRGQRAP